MVEILLKTNEGYDLLKFDNGFDDIFYTWSNQKNESMEYVSIESAVINYYDFLEELQ